MTPNTTVLFIGDSVTDAGRERSDPNGLGGGYPRLVAETYTRARPGDGVRFLNRGISGNRVRDLRARWQEDCLDLTPDVVSILIGINDTWRRYDSGDATSADDFARDYDHILARTTDALPARLVLVEPFLLPVTAGQHGWREDLDPKLEVVRRLAKEYAATLVPLDGLMAGAAADREATDLAADGVHPTDEGHALIARSWLEATTS
nr:SGNH/GDSL hydrolase family protein [Actinopolymorpha cephalotaxi]